MKETVKEFLKLKPKKTTHQAHTQKNKNNHTVSGDWPGQRNEVSWKKMERVWISKTEFTNEETGKVSPGGTPTQGWQMGVNSNR